MAIYSRLQLFLAHPVPSAIGGLEKQDGCLDQKHFTGIKLTAIPVIQVAHSPRWLNIIAGAFFTATNWTSCFLKELNDTRLMRMIERSSLKQNESKTFRKQTQCIPELLHKSSDLSPFNINSIYYTFYSAVKKEDCQCRGVAVIWLLKKVVIQ